MKLPLLKDANVSGKTVFLRADLDVPIVEGKSGKGQGKRIEDDTRLVAAIPTIEYLLKQNAKIVIGGHLGRPEGLNHEARIKNYELSLKPIAEWFAKKLTHDSSFIIHDSKLGGFGGWQIGPNIFLLENLRFYEGEEKNDPEFSKKLSSLAQIYVNDAFTVSHRNHASIVGVPKFLPHFAGLHLEKEITNLTRAIENPNRPLVVIIGGKKIETKLPLVEKMHKIADYVLVGGKIAQESKAFLKVRHEKISGKKSVLLVADLLSDGNGITEKSLYNFLDIISLAKTIIWNGSMGLIGEKEDEFLATRKIAEGILKSGAYSVIGGGDTIDFLNRIKLTDKFLASRSALPSLGGGSFVSTGGGAMLSFLSGEKLPGIEALRYAKAI